MGVNYTVSSAFVVPASGINPIGPDPDVDNPWCICPPVFLHGMDAGTLMKLSETSLQYVVQRAESLGISCTTICREVDAFCAKVYVANTRNGNVEIGTKALLPQPHGITEHLLSGKTLDGNTRASVARLMHLYIATCRLFNDNQRLQHCLMFELVWECREIMSWPMHRCQSAEVQEKMNDMDRNLVKYMLPFSKSQCRSEKHHQWAHYCFHRVHTGCSAKEYAFERSYAVGHKKQVQFTNKAKTKAIQTAAKHWFRTGVHRLAVHMKLIDLEESEVVRVRTDHLENSVCASAFKWPSSVIETNMLRKARDMNPPLQLTRSSTTLHVTLRNRMAQLGAKDRLVAATFRANLWTKHPWVDNIRIQYRDDDDLACVGFAKCLGFFGDANSNNFVAIQWYNICGRRPIQRLTRMCKVELMESYQFIPVGAILNGALLVPLATEPEIGYPQQFWVVQSHRETVALERLNA